MGNMSSKNTINDESYQGLKATSGAAHVSIQNSVPVYSNSTEGEADLITTTGSTIVLGDLTVYGLPFGSFTFTKTNTGTATITYMVVNNVFMFQVSATAGTIAVTMSAETVGGDTFAGPLPYVTQLGDVSVADITADGVYFMYMGSAVS